MNDLFALHRPAFRRHQEVGLRHAGHYQDACFVSHFIGFLVRHHSDLALLSSSPPVFSRARNPEPGNLIHLALLRRFCRDAQMETPCFLCVKCHSRGPISLRADVLRLHHVLLRPVRIPVAVPAPAHQLRVQGGLNGVPVIVPGHCRRVDGFVFLVNVAVRGNPYEESSVSGDDGVRSGDLAVASVGHSRLDAVAHVSMPPVELRRNVNHELSVGTQCSAFFQNLFACHVPI